MIYNNNLFSFYMMKTCKMGLWGVRTGQQIRDSFHKIKPFLLLHACLSSMLDQRQLLTGFWDMGLIRLPCWMYDLSLKIWKVTLSEKLNPVPDKEKPHEICMAKST